MITKIGKFNEKNKVPTDLFTGNYKLYAFNPLKWDYSNDLLAYCKETYKTVENFTEAILKDETHWGYEEN